MQPQPRSEVEQKRNFLTSDFFLSSKKMVNKMITYFILLYSLLTIKMSDGYETKKLTNSFVSGKELKVGIGEVSLFIL